MCLSYLSFPFLLFSRLRSLTFFINCIHLFSSACLSHLVSSLLPLPFRLTSRRFYRPPTLRYPGKTCSSAILPATQATHAWKAHQNQKNTRTYQNRSMYALCLCPEHGLELSTQLSLLSQYLSRALSGSLSLCLRLSGELLES